jgi:hypothetical protein
MTLERKLLIVAGAFIIALIIAIGFFSLGLYIGQRGIFPDSPSVTGPGGLPGQPGQAGQPPPGGPGGGPGQPSSGVPGGSPGQPGAQPPPGDSNSPKPEARPSNLPPGPPDLVGPLQTVDVKGVTIGTPQGSRLVRLEADTQIFDAQGESLSAETLIIGAHLAIFGHFTDDGRTMIAETVIILPPPGGAPPAPQWKTQ